MNRPKSTDPMSDGNTVNGAGNEGDDRFAAPLGPITGGRLEFVRGDQHFGAIGGETRLESPDYAGATDRYGITGGASDVSVDTR